MKKIHFIPLFFCLVFLFACKESLTIPDAFGSAKTEKHTRISGTQVFLLMPEDFTQKRGTSFYTGSQGEILMVIQNNVEPVGEIIKNWESNEGAKGQNLESKDVTVGSYRGRYNLIRKGKAQLTHNLFFGDSTFGIVITGVVQSTDPERNKIMLDILKSAALDKSLSLNGGEEDLPYKVGENSSGFVLAQTIGLGGIYGIPGNDSAEMAAIAIPLDTEKVDLKELVTRQSDMIEKRGFRDLTFLDENDSTWFYALPSLERLQTAEYEGRHVLVYMHAKQWPGLVILCRAMMTNTPESIQQCKEFAHSVAPK